MKNVFVLLLSVFFPIAALSQNMDMSSEEVTVDYLFLSALHGETPLVNIGVYPLSLQWVKNNIAVGSAGELQQFRTYVEQYYSPFFTKSADTNLHWFSSRSDRFRLFDISDGRANAMGEAGGMIRAGYVNGGLSNENFMLGRLSVRAMGNIGDNFGFMLDLSNGARFSGLSSNIAVTDETLSRTFKFNNEEQTFFDRYAGYVQYQSSWMRIRYGREQFSFGFSPIDNLVHSRNAPLMDGLSIDVPYKSVRFTMTHSAADGVMPDGSAVLNKYVASHRIQADIFENLSVAVHDVIVYSGRGLDFSYLNPLGFYVSTGLSTTQKSTEDNSMLGAEIAYRPWKGALFYASLLADDIGFSTIFDTSWRGNNNKYAWQLGVSHALSAIAGKPLMISAEYMRLNPFVYSHRLNSNSWTHLGGPLGYGMQPNSDRWALQARFWLAPRIFAKIDMDYTRHGENILDSNGNLLVRNVDLGGGVVWPYFVGNVGGDMLQGSGDTFYPEELRVGNAFMRGNISHTRRISLWLSAEPYNNVFVDLRLRYLNRNGGNNPLELFWTAFEFRVGY